MTAQSSTPANSARTSRWLLIAAALLAVGAVGVRLWKARSVESAPTTAANPQEDVGVMITQLEAKLKQNPDDAEGWRMLGWSLGNTQKYAEAVLAYRRATQLAPNNAEGWSALGEVLILANKDQVTPEAKAAFTKALALDPKDARAHFFSAMGLHQEGKHQAALDGLFKLIETAPADAPWAPNVRAAIEQVSATSKIPVADRLAKLAPAPSGGGAERAAAAIPGPTSQDMRNATAMPKGQQDAMITGMVEGLEAKLNANPKQLDRWIMLMRSRTQLGETAKAKAALERARAAFAGDQAALTQLSEAADLLGIK